MFAIVTFERSRGVSPSNSASFAPVYLIYVGLFLLPLKGSGARYGTSVSKSNLSVGIFLTASCRSWAVS